MPPQTLTLVTCERYHCHLLPSACIARQQEAKRYDKRLVETDLALSFQACLACPQGQQIAREYPQNIETTKEPIMETPKPEKQYMCMDCGKQPAAISPRTNRPITGLCPSCNGKRIKAGMAKKKQEKAAAKEAAARKILQKTTESIIQKYERNEDPTPQNEQEQPDAEKPILLQIDFTHHPEVWDRIQRDAAADLRPTDLHALWIIRDYLDGFDE